MSTHVARAQSAEPQCPDVADELGRPLHVREAARLACARIAPAWPLDRIVAVNPFWERVDEPLAEVSAELGALSGARLLMPRGYYREAWTQGRFARQDLEEALALEGSARGVDDLLARLERDEPTYAPIARVMDLVDELRTSEREMSFRDFIVHTTSQFCAAHFDDGQATIGPSREGGLYASFRREAPRDRSPSLLMGLDRYRRVAEALPETAESMAIRAAQDLGIATGDLERYFAALLLDVNGWASHCAYRRWQARRSAADDSALTHLLSVRLAWEWMLYQTGGVTLTTRFRREMSTWSALGSRVRRAQQDDWVFQRALELAERRPVTRRLAGAAPSTPPRASSVQAVFCMDARSEVFRRAFEAESLEIETLGSAGFFGLPIEYRPLGAREGWPQLPGLLAPRLTAQEECPRPREPSLRAGRLAAKHEAKAFQSSPSSSLVFVEALGLSYLFRLLAETFGARDGAGEGRAEPRLADGADRGREKLRLADAAGEPLDDASRANLAADILRSMSLTRRFARMVLLVGHGSSSRNNPHASGLDCAACGGQSGEVNARAAAALLNDRSVRPGLLERGISVPDETRFVPALHDTATDDVAIFDGDELPASHRDELSRVQGWLERAGAAARRERAARFTATPGAAGAAAAGGGSAGIRAARALSARALRARARDWANIRPEWGLAGHAFLVIARRERTRHLDLEGRAFLYEYRAEDDPTGAVLERILTGPLLVAHWINFQYYASTVDPVRYGSGNKLLHNVVGGHLGVFEGNGGDLRIGLPLQSLHDGVRWVHTPLRLAVYVEAAASAIDAVLAKHPKVRALVDNGWVDWRPLPCEPWPT